jgi:hypothetical protein
LLAYAESFGKQIGFDQDQRNAIKDEMRSGDYRNLVETFDKHFGGAVDLILPDNWDDYIQEEPGAEGRAREKKAKSRP